MCDERRARSSRRGETGGATVSLPLCSAPLFFFLSHNLVIDAQILTNDAKGQEWTRDDGRIRDDFATLLLLLLMRPSSKREAQASRKRKKLPATRGRNKQGMDKRTTLTQLIIILFTT